MKHLKRFENYIPNDDSLDLFNETGKFKELISKYWKSSPVGGGSIEFCDWLLNIGLNIYDKNGEIITQDVDWYDVLKEFDKDFDSSTEYTDFLRWLEMKNYDLK